MDDIIRMAQEAQQERLSLDGRSPSTALSGHWFAMEVADLARFAALVCAAEREACAVAGGAAADAGLDVAAAIRARAQQPPATVEDRLARHGIPMPEGDPK